MRMKFCNLALLLVASLTVAAQEIPKAEVYIGYSFIRVDPGSQVNNFTTNGGIGSFQFNLTNHFGLVAELGGYHSGNISIGQLDQKLDQTQFTYLFGPRVFFNKAGTVSPFMHFLVGGVHNSRSFGIPNDELPVPLPPIPPGVTVEPGATTTRFKTSQNAYAMAVGGGVDIRLSRRFSVRPVQLDYLPTHFSPFDIPGLGTINEDKWQNNLRYSAGLSFRFGGAEPIPPRASCSGTPTELLPDAGPVTVTATPADFNPKHTLTYKWASTGGSVVGDGSSAKVDVSNLSPGSYTATATVTDPKEKKMNSASCSTSFTVKQPQPPEVSCAASPSTVHVGDPVTVTAQGTSPDGRQIKTRNFSASAGSLQEGQTTAEAQPGSWSSTATLDTSNAPPGPLSVTVGVADVRGLTGSCVAQVNVEAQPAPVTVVSEQLVSECEFKNERKLARIDNECKAILDEVALRLQHEPDGRLVIVGYAEEEEVVQVDHLESYRAYNAKQYLTAGEAKQGIDASRIEVRQSGTRGQGNKAKFYVVPAGGSFTVTETVVVDETQMPADTVGVPKKKK